MDITGSQLLRRHAEDLGQAVRIFTGAIATPHWESMAARAFHAQADSLIHVVAAARRALLAAA